MFKLDAKELRTTKAEENQKNSLQKNPVYIIVDNVIDTYNIGSIFRLADAIAAKKVYLCGVSETPPHTRIKKASVNTTEWVEWEYFPHTLDAIAALRKTVAGVSIVAIEQHRRSITYDAASYSFPIAVIVGNESTGISQEVLDLVDAIVELPMWGVNISLNVMVSLGIVLYEIMKRKK